MTTDSDDVRAREAPAGESSLGAAFAARRLRIGLVALAVFVATLIAASLLPATWRSEARLLVDLGDRRRSAAVGEAGDLDDRLITAQIRLVGSREVLRRAVAASGVLADGAADPAAGWADGLLRALGLDASGSRREREDRLVAALESRLVAERVDRTRLLVVRLSARGPDGLSRLLAAVLDEYLSVVAEARSRAVIDAERRSSEEIESLREEIAAAEARVEGARAAAGIVESDADARESVARDLTAAKTRRAEIETRLRLLERGNDRKALDGAGGDDVSPLIARLRDRRNALRARVTELGNVYLSAHPTLQEANSQLAEVERQLRAELPRAVATLEGERDAAGRRMAALEKRLAELSAPSPLPTGEELRTAVHARDLETLRGRLSAALARRHAASEAIASTVGPDVRLVSPPSVPVDAAVLGPWSLAAIAGLFAAALAGLGVAADHRRAVRARRRLAAPVVPPAAVGVVPVDGRIAAEPDAASRLLPGDIADPLESAARASLERIWSEIVAGRGRGRRILVTAATGASAAHSAALALMRVAARRDASVCLIDLVASTSGLAARLGEEAPLGLSDLLDGRATFSDVVFRDRTTRGHVVVAGSAPLDPLDVDRVDLDGVLEALDQTYDHLVLDVGRINAAEGIAALIASADAVVLAADGNACDPLTLRAHETLLAADKEVWVLAVGLAAVSEVDRAA